MASLSAAGAAPPPLPAGHRRRLFLSPSSRFTEERRSERDEGEVLSHGREERTSHGFDSHSGERDGSFKPGACPSGRAAEH